MSGERKSGPLVAVVVSAFERAAVLIEKGTAPAKAMRQVGQELIDYEAAFAGSMIPGRTFAEQLGQPQQRRAA